MEEICFCWIMAFEELCFAEGRKEDRNARFSARRRYRFSCFAMGVHALYGYGGSVAWPLCFVGGFVCH